MSRRLPSCAAALIGSLLIAVCAPGVGRAQDVEPRVAEARAHFERGEEHYAASRYALAAQEYRRSHELLMAASHPHSAFVLFNVGRSLQELGGRDAEARQAYADFLASAPVTEETQEMIRLAQAHMRELDARLAPGSVDAASASARGDISPVGPIVLGVGGAALLSGLVLVGVAHSRDQEHIASCPGRVDCTPSLRDEVEHTPPSRS